MFEDFGGVFGGRAGHRRQGVPRGWDLETEEEVTLDEVLNDEGRALRGSSILVAGIA